MNVGKTKIIRISRDLSTVQIMINQKQLENVEYFKYFSGKITNHARCTHKIKSTIPMAKVAFSNEQNLFTRKLKLIFRKRLLKCYIRNIALYDAETWDTSGSDHKYLEFFQMLSWRRIEKIGWMARVKYEVLPTLKRKETSYIQLKERKLIGLVISCVGTVF